MCGVIGRCGCKRSFRSFVMDIKLTFSDCGGLDAFTVLIIMFEV